MFASLSMLLIALYPYTAAVTLWRLLLLCYFIVNYIRKKIPKPKKEIMEDDFIVI